MWGYCGSPLIVAGRLIVQPGGKNAAMVALDPKTGDVVWESAGRKTAYASLIAAEISGKVQIIGYDASSLGGWDPETGRRLWEVVPEQSGDFNVPTPIRIGDRLFVTSENNGARLYAFDADGTINAPPVAAFAGLNPDTHTPVTAGGRIIGLQQSLQCLDASTLKPVWALENPGLGEYASLLSDGKSRVLALGENGLLALYETGEAKARELGRLQLGPDDAHILAYPALVGDRLFIRLGNRAACLILSADGQREGRL